MASGVPVVLSDDAALREVAGDAGVYADDGDFAGAVRRALADRARFVLAGLERARGFTWERTARLTAEVYRGCDRMKVAAVVVSHGHPRELEQSLPALRAQVDELVVIANIPGSVPPASRPCTTASRSASARTSTSASRATTAELVVSANPDAVPEPGAVAVLQDIHGRPPALRDRRAAHGVPRRHVAALAAALSDGRRHDRAPHAAAPRAAAASPLPPRRVTARPSRSRRTGCSAAS